MPRQTRDSFHRSLKQGLEPVYYFYGPENILKDDAIQALLDQALDPSMRDFNYDTRAAGQLDPESLHSLLNTLPMMAERRVVLLRDIEGLKRKTRLKAVLEAYLDRPSTETVLVMVQGSGDNKDKDDKPDPALTRNAVAVEFEPLPPDRALKWIAHHAGKLGLELSPDATDHLFESVGNDLGALRMELDKLAGLAGAEPVGVDAVAELVGVRRGETLQSWRDFVLDGEVKRALPLVGPVLEQSGMSGVRMVSSLGSALVGLGMARPLLDKGIRSGALQQKILSTLYAIRPFGLGEWKTEAGKWARWAPDWPMDRVRRALRAARDADLALKNTRISDERGVVTDLVLRLAPEPKGAVA